MNSSNARIGELEKELKELKSGNIGKFVSISEESKRAQPITYRVRISGKTHIIGSRQHELLYRISQKEILTNKRMHTRAEECSLQRLVSRKIIEQSGGCYSLTALGEKIFLALNHEILEQCTILSGLPSVESLRESLSAMLVYLEKVDKVPSHEIKITVSWPNRKRD